MDENNNIIGTVSASNKPSMRKKTVYKYVKTILKYFFTFFFIGILFTMITAIFPIFPFQLQTKEDLDPIKFGVPFKFLEMTPDSETIDSFKNEKDIASSFFFPRYGLYEFNIIWWKVFANIMICGAFFAFVYFFFTYLKKIAKKVLLFLLLGFVAAAISTYIPKKFEIDELSPMNFGGVIPFLEQTPNKSIYTSDRERLERYLSSQPLTPRFGSYTSHIVIWKLILSSAINGAIIAGVWYSLRLIKRLITGKEAEPKEPKKISKKALILPYEPENSTLHLKNSENPLDKSKK